MPYPMGPFPVYARLVGSDHPGEQILVFPRLPYILGTFVNTKEMPYPVPGSVSVIAEVSPQWVLGKHIQVCPFCPFQKYGPAQGYHTFQGNGVIFPFQRGKRPKRDGPGDVCRPIQVMTS